MMSRGNPAPWFRPSRNTYFVTIGGKQHKSHTADKAEALIWGNGAIIRAIPISVRDSR
jgi:hypothetical protein